MIKRNKFTPKKIGLSAWGVLTLFTLLVFIVGTRHFTDGALVLMWCFFSWNFYAYAFDRGMWPRVLLNWMAMGEDCLHGVLLCSGFLLYFTPPYWLR